MCWPHDKCLSIVMPRNFTHSSWFKGILSMIIFCDKVTFLRVVWKCIKWVLLIFKDNLLLLNHDETLINSKFIIFINSLKLLWDSKMLVSSANKTNDKMGEELTISLIYIKNNKGPRIEPCGTPQLIWEQLIWEFAISSHLSPLSLK